MNWIMVVLGVVLTVSPFVTGYNDMPVALWTNFILGIVIAALGLMKSYKVTAFVGIAAGLTPFLLGFSGNGWALWVCLITGAAVALLAGYKGFFSEPQAKSPGVGA